MKTLKVTFKNADDERLAALLDLPVDQKPQAFAIFAHCFTCTKNIKAAARISRTLAQEGIAVLRFDFTGLGDSEGDFAETNFSSNVEDLISAADFLADDYQSPSLLIGHSLGGAAVLKAAGEIESVRAVISIAAPADPAHIVQHLDLPKGETLRVGETEVRINGRSFKVKQQFLDDLAGSRLEAVIADLKKPLLIMHSPFDKIVSIDHAGRIYAAATHPKSFVSLDTADHLLSDEQDALYAGKMAATWACKFLGMQRAEPAVSYPENRVIAKIGQGFVTEIIANGHPLVADEPIAVGGTNTGPSPYDLLVAGLGACTAMTLRMYADHKELPLESVTVTLAHEKIHAADCQTCETEEGKIDRIERVIEMDGDLTDEQRQRLLEIANRCPVHRTLHSEVEMVTRLAENGESS